MFKINKFRKTKTLDPRPACRTGRLRHSGMTTLSGRNDTVSFPGMTVFIGALILVNFLSLGWSRPLLTHEATPVGLLNFEAGLSLSQRNDEFGSPSVKYETVEIPYWAKMGIHRRLDIGVTLRHVSHRLFIEGEKFSGSANSQVSPEFKLGLYDHWAIKGIWHAKRPEKSNQLLPIGQGSDYELLLLYSRPGFIPVHLNVGYEWQSDYKSTLGIRGGPLFGVEPGNIFEARAALEYPLVHRIYVLGELAYYAIDEKRINGSPLPGSKGEALDALIGLTWSHQEWNIGLGAGFGLLDETHTSFDLVRGAGDIMVKGLVSYKLLRKRFKR